MPERKGAGNYFHINRRTIYVGPKLTEEQKLANITEGRCREALKMAEYRNISPYEAYDLLPLTGIQMTEFLRQLEILRQSPDLRDAFVHGRIKAALDLWQMARDQGQNYPA